MGKCPLALKSEKLYLTQDCPSPRMLRRGILYIRVTVMQGALEEDAGRDANMLEFSMVVLVYN